MMPAAARLCFLLIAAAFLLAGCASPSAPPPNAPLPDGRQLGEDPLDVVNLPQP